MDLKNTAMKFFGAEYAEETMEEYTGPRLLKAENLNIMVRTPKSFADVREYADALIGGSAILVSFDAVDSEVMNRIFDYLNGVAYIVNAHVSAVSGSLLLYTPEQVEINKDDVVKRKTNRSWLG